MHSRTIYQVLQATAAAYGGKPALRQPVASEKGVEKSGAKNYKTWTWDQHLLATEEIGLGLHALGIRKGDILQSINGEPTPELASQVRAMVDNGLYDHAARMILCY